MQTTKKNYIMLYFCLVLAMLFPGCDMLLPKSEMDFYIDYYNMTEAINTGAGCKLYLGAIPEIRWQGYDKVTGYQLQVSREQDFKNLLIDETNLTTTTYQLATPFTVAGSYYYRIKLKTPGGNWSAWGETKEIKLYTEELLDSCEVLPTDPQAIIPWEVEGEVKPDSNKKITGSYSLAFKTDTKQTISSLSTMVYCASESLFSFWFYKDFYDSNVILFIDGIQKEKINDNSTWTFKNFLLTTGYHTLEIKCQNTMSYGISTGVCCLEDVQFFPAYYEKADACFAGMGTALTGYTFSGNLFPKFKTAENAGLYMEMGRGLRYTDETVTLNLSVAAPQWLSFSYIVNQGYYYEGDFAVSCNSAVYYNSDSYMSGWKNLVISLAAGTNTLKLSYNKYFDNENAVASVRNWQYLSALDGFENNNFDTLDWTPGGTLPINIQSSTRSEGTYAVQFGNSTNNTIGNGTLQLNLYVGREAVVFFDFMVSSNSSSYPFRFSVDSTQMASWYNLSGWRNYNYTLSPGNHILTWAINDNYTTSAIQAWLDNLRISTTDYHSP